MALVPVHSKYDANDGQVVSTRKILLLVEKLHPEAGMAMSFKLVAPI
jgi:hypothetical protein